ncbi:MAG TPA: hypothetical protein VM536_00555 [Chloroflexia bacterium]|nr:hypothetical protein [Chloroflexia bacterium]
MDRISVLLQVLPPLRPPAGFDLVNFLVNAVAALFWAVIAVLIFSFAVGVAMRIFTALTPGLDEMAELRRGNTAVALVMVAFIIAVMGVMVAVLIK